MFALYMPEIAQIQPGATENIIMNFKADLPEGVIAIVVFLPSLQK